MDAPPFLASEAALADFLAAFEQQRLPGSAWTHAAHIAMAAVYLRRYGHAVLRPTREAIQRFNASVGGPPTAYHETLTILWLAVVADFLDHNSCASDFDAACSAVAAFGFDNKLHKRFYSYDVIASPEARQGWAPPDAKAITVPFALPTA